LNLLADLGQLPGTFIGRRSLVTARISALAAIVIADVPRRLRAPHFNYLK